MAIRNFAAEAFGTSGGGTLSPRHKFQFTLVLHIAGVNPIEFTRVSAVSQASYSFDTQIVNQYNKKRVIQTKVNYDPVTVSFYDTQDNQWHEFWKLYMAHYYHGGRGLDPTSTTDGSSVTVPEFTTISGFTPNAERYFFPKITIVEHGLGSRLNGSNRETILVNPMITEMKGDTLDYSDSQLVQYSVTFQPESVVTRNVPLSTTDPNSTGPQ